MATLIKHSSGVYYIVFYERGKRIWKTLSTRDRYLAYDRFRELENAGPHGQALAIKEVFISKLHTKEVRLSDAIDEFSDYVRVNMSVKTQKDYTSVMRLVARFFGPGTVVSDIKLKDIERYKAEKHSKNVSPHTVNHNIRCIKAFFNRLIQWEYLEKNPCRGVRQLRTDDTIRPYLQRDELQKLLAQVRHIEERNVYSEWQ